MTDLKPKGSPSQLSLERQLLQSMQEAEQQHHYTGIRAASNQGATYPRPEKLTPQHIERPAVSELKGELHESEEYLKAALDLLAGIEFRKDVRDDIARAIARVERSRIWSR